MRSLLLLPLALASALPVLAQEKLDLASALPAPQEKSATGSIETLIDGLPSRASVSFSAPDSLRFDVPADATTGSLARTVQAQGAQTLAVEGTRARRAGFNGLSGWFRASNDPLLQALGPWLSPTRELELFYTLSLRREGTATIIEATANDKGKYLRREQVRSGGVGGQRFYAAREAASWDRPARMRLRVEQNHIVRREDFGADTSAPGAQPRPLQAWTWRYENGRPTLIEARDSANALRARWSLSFDAAANAAALEAPLEAPPEAIIEGDAPQGDESAQQFPSGLASSQSESYARAVAALSRANALKPRAVAVPLALFEIALGTRNNALAQAALLKIQALDGEASPRYALARARLALQNSSPNAAGALDALAQVLGDGPNASLRLPAADLMRAAGRREQASALLLPLLDEKVPTPIAASAIARLDEWFSPLDQAARGSLADKIAGASASAQVARAVLKNQASAVDASASPEMESLLARGAALSGRDDEAARRWKSVAQGANEALMLSAQLALAQLAARRNDAPGALAAHHAAWPMLSGERERENWLRALLSSWLKADHLKALRTALRDSSLRPLGRATTLAALDEAEADARLLVAAQEADGDSEATSTLRAQAARWKGVGGARAAWWQGHVAEILAGETAQAASEPGTAQQQERLYDEASRAVDAAIVLEPDQPFYAEQKLLLAARRVSSQGGVTDAATGVRAREDAQAALASLRQRFPRSADALLSGGLALLTMKQERAAVPLLKAALLQIDAPPAAGEEAPAQDSAGERVARVTARSSLAGALRRAGDVEGAMRLHAILFEGSRSPVEQGAFAANWLNALFEARDAAGPAEILSQIARSGWKPSQTQEVLAQVLASVSVRAGWRQAVRQSLEVMVQNPAEGTAPLAEGSALVAAYLDFSALNSARRAALPAEKATEDPPAAADPKGAAGGTTAGAAAQQALGAAIAQWRLDVAQLQKLAGSVEPGVAGQALSLLAQDSLLRGQDAEASSFFERALERVPSDEGLALSMSSTLQPQAQAGAKIAAEDAARIVKARDALLARGPLGPSGLQQAALMSRQAGRAQDARALLARARALAFFDESVSAGEYDDLSAPVAEATGAGAAK